ncbi:hypothetical protein CN325_14280 [Bacillus thuringiensis]|nr:hypothetical protein CN325_14280 [Bacillus thuringiensis]
MFLAHFNREVIPSLYLKVYYKRKRLCRRFIPLFAGSKTPPQNSAKAKKLGGRAACKSPIDEG